MHGLNAIGVDDVIAVDDLSDGAKFKNLVGASLSDYFDRRDFYARFAAGELGPIDCVFHEGACSDTMEHDGRLMLDLNFRSSKTLLDACQAQGVRLLYASSAATYGGSTAFREEPEFERPLNVYGWSKLLFDQVVRRALPAAKTQIAGFRYFNVYGPREQHKGRMASVAFHQFNEWQATGRVKLFGEYGGYAPGEQRRDFVAVSDVVAVNLWFLEHPRGERHLQPRQRPGAAVQRRRPRRRQRLPRRSRRGGAAARRRWSARASIDYIDFPPALVGKYQCFTEADLGRLRAVGCQHAFVDVAGGVADYVAWLQRQA